MATPDATVHRIRCDAVPQLKSIWDEFNASELPRVGSASSLFNNQPGVATEIKKLGKTCFTPPPIKQSFDRGWAFQYDQQWVVHLGRMSMHADLALSSPLARKIEEVFNGEARLSGYFYYPPGGFKEWHTDYEDPPEEPEKRWRVYMIKTTKDNKSWFQYFDTKNRIRKIMDRNGYLNVFHLTETPPLWHAVYSNTHRWCIGIKFEESVLETLLEEHGQ
ncbi:MAG: hypothetical protein AAF458_20815 [Pseudomonadota bacterium]